MTRRSVTSPMLGRHGRRRRGGSAASTRVHPSFATESPAGTAEGGTATAGDDAYADADAYGFDASGDITNSAAVTVTAEAGTATSDYDADAEAYAEGFDASGDIENSGVVTITSRNPSRSGIHS